MTFQVDMIQPQIVVFLNQESIGDLQSPANQMFVLVPCRFASGDWDYLGCSQWDTVCLAGFRKTTLRKMFFQGAGVADLMKMLSYVVSKGCFMFNLFRMIVWAMWFWDSNCQPAWFCWGYTGAMTQCTYQLQFKTIVWLLISKYIS